MSADVTSAQRSAQDFTDGNDGKRRKPFNPIKSIKKFFGSGATGSSQGSTVGSTRMRALSGDEEEARDPELSTVKARSTTDMLATIESVHIPNKIQTGSSSMKQLSQSVDSVFSSGVVLSVARNSIGLTDPALDHHSNDSIVLRKERLGGDEGGEMRGSRGEEDEGHPRSPLTLPPSADLSSDNPAQLNKWPSFDSDHSLLSVESSDNELEEDIFKDKWHSAGNSSQSKVRIGSDPSDTAQAASQDDMDLSVVRRHMSLKSSAAAHRLAIKPRNKRMSAIYQQKMQAFAHTIPTKSSVTLMESLSTARVDNGHDKQKAPEFIEILPELEEESSLVGGATAEELNTSKNIAAEAAKMMQRRMANKDPVETEATSEPSGVIRRVVRDTALLSEERNSRRQTIAISSEVNQTNESKIIKRSSIHLNDKRPSNDQPGESANEFNQVFSRIQRKSSQRQNEKPEVALKPVSIQNEQKPEVKSKQAESEQECTEFRAGEVKRSEPRPEPRVRKGGSEEKPESSVDAVDVKENIKTSQIKTEADSKPQLSKIEVSVKESVELERKVSPNEHSVKPPIPVQSKPANSAVTTSHLKSSVKPVQSALTSNVNGEKPSLDTREKSKSLERGVELKTNDKIASDVMKEKVVRSDSNDVADKKVILPPIKLSTTTNRQADSSKPAAVPAASEESKENDSSSAGVSLKKSNSVNHKVPPSVPLESGHKKTQSISLMGKTLLQDSETNKNKLESKGDINIDNKPNKPGDTPEIISSRPVVEIKKQDTSVVREGSVRAPASDKVIPVGPSIKLNTNAAPAPRKIGFQLKTTLPAKPSDTLPVSQSSTTGNSMSKSLDSAEFSGTTMSAASSNAKPKSEENIGTDTAKSPPASAPVAPPKAKPVLPSPSSKPGSEPEWFAMARRKTREWSGDKL